MTMVVGYNVQGHGHAVTQTFHLTFRSFVLPLPSHLHCEYPMNITSLDDLIQLAHGQPDPQRLLFVFTRIDAPAPDALPQQHTAYKEGRGGTLTPLACLDKTPEEVGTFQQLNAEAIQHVPDWSIVFVAALGGRAGQVPTTDEAEAPLNKMVEMIKTGRVDGLAPFDNKGDVLVFGP